MENSYELVHNSYDIMYKATLNKILAQPRVIMDRTGVGTKAICGVETRFDMSTWAFPRLQLRNVSPRIAFEELMWMLCGETDVSLLQKKNIKIWDGNTTREALDKYGKHHIKENTIGKGYSYQFRNFGGVDQLKEVVDGLMKNPYGRRHIINLWNVSELKDMALEPCHMMYHFNVIDGKLYLTQIQRSADFILGSPTNIMFAAFFLGLVSALTKIPMGEVINYSMNVHIYANHLEAARKMSLVPDEEFLFRPSLPSWHLNKTINTFEDMLNVEWSDIDMYDNDPILKFTREELPMAV